MTQPLAERLASRLLGEATHAERLAARYVEAESFSTMRQLANRWVAKNPALRARMERALALTGGVTEESPSTFEVEGEGGAYTVMVNRGTKTSTCSCPDSQRGNHCKHRLAVALVTEAKMRDKEASLLVTAFEFSSPELLKKYLKDHPNADAKLHSVRKPGSKPAPAKKDDDVTELGDDDIEIVEPKKPGKPPPLPKKPKLDAPPPKGEGHGEEGGHGDAEGHEAPAKPWKERLKEMSTAAQSFVKTAPKEVKLFLKDDNHRRTVLMAAHKRVEEAPAEVIKSLVATVKEEVHEFKEAGGGVKALLSGGKPSAHQKKAMKTVAFHVGLTIAATALTASGPLAGMAMFGKSMARHVAMKAAGKMFESMHILDEIGHVKHGIGDILSKLAAKKKGVSDDDAETLLVEYIHALIAKELENLDGDDVQQAVEDAAEEHDDLHGDEGSPAKAESKGRKKEAAMRLALWYNTDLRVDQPA